jgi:hypothetical protein
MWLFLTVGHVLVSPHVSRIPRLNQTIGRASKRLNVDFLAAQEDRR